MLKQTVFMGDDIKLLKQNLKREVAQVVAGIVEEEFENLLFDAPQRSGNYVANMAIAAGAAAGRKGGELYFPLKKSTEAMFARGNTPAILKAKDNNANILRNVVNSVTRGAGFVPAITIYNRLTYAEKVESYDQLREENRGGEHAMTKAKERLEARFNEYIDDNSATWQYYVKRGNL